MIGSAEVRKLAIKEICQIIDEKYDEEKYYGILLCEGEMNSLDAKPYSKAYPALLVIPVGGWTDVTKLLRSIRKRNEGIEVFGLIDRDSNSKRKIKELRVNEGVYCTKLPFIESIICTPEIVKILCNVGTDVSRYTRTPVFRIHHPVFPTSEKLHVNVKHVHVVLKSCPFVPFDLG